MSVSYSWIFCFTFLLLIHKVSGQIVHVEGVKGEMATLPCSFKQKEPEVFWRYRDSRTVCDIIGGKAELHAQDPAFRNRVKILSEIEKGNFSIMLINVTESDAGTYTCHAPGLDAVQIQLTVTERPATRTTTVITTPGNGESLRRADGLLALLLGFALLCSLAF